MLLLFKRLIDRSMVTLYNIECKFPVKKMEKSKLRLLVVEDEKKLCDMIAKSLHLAGYEVDMCNDGEQALEMIYAELYDLIVLDLNLPGVDGMEILRELRKENEETKVLILSARSQIADKVEGLDSGANDYMEKPFHLQELEARVRSLTRRKFIQKNICLECGKLRFDTRERVAYAEDNPVTLTRKENGIFRISPFKSRKTGQSGRIDRACLGFFCGQFQWFDPGPYVFSPEKAEGRTWLRSGRK